MRGLAPARSRIELVVPDRRAFGRQDLGHVYGRAAEGYIGSNLIIARAKARVCWRVRVGKTVKSSRLRSTQGEPPGGKSIAMRPGVAEPETGRAEGDGGWRGLVGALSGGGGGEK